MKIAYILGDGIGPEIILNTIKIINHAVSKENNQAIEWTRFDLSSIFTNQGKKEISKFKYILKGPTITPVGSGHYSANVQLRKELNLYASLRKFENLTSTNNYTKHNNLPEIVLISNGIDCVYSGMEISSENKEDNKIFYELIKRFGSKMKGINKITLRTSNTSNNRKLAKYVKKYITNNDLHSVIIAHKADIMKISDGDFLESMRYQLSSVKNYSEVIAGPIHTRLIEDPKQFSLIVTTNFLRCTISHTLAGIFGGIVFGPGCSIGDNHIVYESTHGAAPQIANTGMANPTSTILSACIMLDDIGMKNCSKRIKNALKKTIKINKISPVDIKNKDNPIKHVNAGDFVKTIMKNI